MLNRRSGFLLDHGMTWRVDFGSAGRIRGSVDTNGEREELINGEHRER